MSRGSPRWQIYCLPRRLQPRCGAGRPCNAHIAAARSDERKSLTSVATEKGLLLPWQPSFPTASRPLGDAEGEASIMIKGLEPTR